MCYITARKGDTNVHVKIKGKSQGTESKII